MLYDQSYYQSIWHAILRQYTSDSPIHDLGDRTRATLVARFVLRYAFASRSSNVHRQGDQCDTYHIHDYGAGNWLYLGALFHVCAQQPYSVRITGVDYSEEALSFGLRKFQRTQPANVEAKIEQGDILQVLTQQKTESVDCVLCLETLEHVYTDQEIFRHYSRILKPGGILIVSVPNKQPFFLSANWFSYVFFRQQFTTKDRRVGHVRRYTRDSLFSLAMDTPMTVLHTECYGFFLSDYLKRLVAWMDRSWPYTSRALFPLLLRLLFLEHRWWNLLSLQRSEGIFVVFKKHD